MKHELTEVIDAHVKGGDSITRVGQYAYVFAHDPHLYRTQRGKVKACDGSVTKRGGKA